MSQSLDSGLAVAVRQLVLHRSRLMAKPTGTWTVPAAAVGHPDGDAVHVDVLEGAANEVINRLRDLGLELRGWRSMA